MAKIEAYSYTFFVKVFQKRHIRRDKTDVFERFKCVSQQIEKILALPAETPREIWQIVYEIGKRGKRQKRMQKIFKHHRPKQKILYPRIYILAV